MNTLKRSSTRPLARGSRASRASVLALGALALSLAIVPGAQAANPETNGSVKTVVSDGSGGVYIGGSFTTVNGASAPRLAHVKADGTLDTSFTPNVNDGVVNAIALSGGNVYLVGTFTKVNSSSVNRNRAAKVSGSTGALDPSWNPNLSSDATAVTVSGSDVYIGGAFSSIGSPAVSQRSLVKVNVSSGARQPWDPAIATNGLTGVTVNSIAVDGGSVYFVGKFNSVGGQTRNSAAKVSANDGSLDSSWNPNLLASSGAAASIVYTILVANSSAYVGGNFSQVGGTNGRAYAAKLDLSSGAYDSGFLPGPVGGGSATQFIAVGSTIYAVGNFTSVNSTPRGGGFAVSGGSLTAWNPGANGQINGIVIRTGSQIVIGGEFTTVASAAQTYLAALSIGTPATPAIDSVPATPVDKGTTIKSSGYSDSPMPLFEWQRCLVLNDSSSCTVTIAGQSGAWYGTRDADIGYQVRVRTYWQTVSGVVEAFSALSGIVVPVGTVAPALSSQSPKVGTNIASSFGTWQGWITNTSTVAYEWQQCNTSSSNVCSAIAGAPNAANYKPVAGSVGKYLRVKVTITTRGQSASQFSAITTNAIAS